jgi:predicted transcriptional regulator
MYARISVFPLEQSKATGKLTPSLSQMRTQIDIMASILNEAAGGTRKTHIMYGCNLSYRQLQSYLKLLVSMKLLSTTSEKKSRKITFFETTAKGQNFLLAYCKLKALMTSSSSTP